MAILRLKGVIVGSRAVPHQIEFTGKIGIRRDVNILPHQFSAARTEISNGEYVGPAQPLFQRGVPLIGSGQEVMRVNNRQIVNGGACGKWRRRGGGITQRKGRAERYLYLA